MSGIYLGCTGLAAVLLLTACTTGIFPAAGPAVQVDSALPLGKLKNDVVDPDTARWSLNDYCGHLVQKTPSGYTPLYISAYPAGQGPTLTNTDSNNPPSFHSLFSQGGNASLTAAYGPGSAGFNLTGQDRLEVTVTTRSYCRATSIDKAAVQAALATLTALAVPRNQVYFVGAATHTQMTVDLLRAITANEQGAATPIVNFAGQNYSNSSATKISNYVSLDAVPISAALTASTGTSVPATSVPQIPAAQPVGKLVAKTSVAGTRTEIGATVSTMQGSLGAMIPAEPPPPQQVMVTVR